MAKKQKPAEKDQQRLFGADAVRVLALILLLWLHFLLRNGFYSQPVNSASMTIFASGRCLFMCCIPLFLMLTGYLKCGKEWKKGYYNGLLPIMISWVIISAVCLWYKITVLDQVKTARQWIVEFFEFKLANYSWYIEMYIGLLLLSPFLNMAWNGLKTKKDRQIMIFIFMLLTFIPTTVNGITIGEEAVLNPIPNYWTGLYYFTYYLIGCYFRAYPPKINSAVCVCLALAVALGFGLLNRFTGGETGNFYKGFTISYNHLGTVAMSVLLFMAFIRLKCQNTRICAVMAAISKVTLEMYLISCVFDQGIYVWKKGEYGPEQYWWRGLLATGLVFLLSYLSGSLIHEFSAWLSRRILKKQ